MPEFGEVKIITRLDKKGYASPSNLIWSACKICGKGRWVSFRKRDGCLTSLICKLCSQSKRGMNKSGPNHNFWKGGRHKTPDGYIGVYVSPDSPFYLMSDVNHYVAEHRLIMAQHLGRCLDKREIVHHVNRIRSDNRIENLQLVNKNEHKTDAGAAFAEGYRKGFINGAQSKNKALELQIKLLYQEVKKLREDLQCKLREGN